MRLLLSVGVSNLDADVSDNGVEDRVLFGKFAKLVSGARDVSDAGGVSSRLPGSDLMGVLEKCSRLDRTSVCCNQHYGIIIAIKRCAPYRNVCVFICMFYPLSLSRSLIAAIGAIVRIV